MSILYQEEDRMRTLFRPVFVGLVFCLAFVLSGFVSVRAAEDDDNQEIRPKHSVAKKKAKADDEDSSQAVQPKHSAGKKADDDEPPPLGIVPDSPAGGSKKKAKEADDGDDNIGPAKASPSDDSPKGKKKKGRASRNPGNKDYKPEAGDGKREEEISSAEKQLEEVVFKGKKDANDFFVLVTIALKNHKAEVDYPIIQGLRKAAEYAADFSLDADPGEIRKWKAYGRAKNEKAGEFLKKQAQGESIEGKLEAFKLTKGSGRKTPDDYFVVGTAELNTRTENADVRFKVVGGTKATASYLLDFILTTVDGIKRQWNVFFRLKTQAEADKYIADLRSWYDSMESERARIAQIYHARTTQRC
jgi:hypothetical protein